MFKLLTFPLRVAAKAVALPFQVAALPVKAVTYPLRGSKHKRRNKQADVAEMLLLAELDDLIGY